jgi:transposase
VAALAPWLQAADDSGISELQGFAGAIRSDQEAISASLLYPWSQGQVEGSVNKLKLIKRSGYGRTGLDLLCRRLIHAA